MSQEGFANVIGRAVLDANFATALNEDPKVAADSIGAHLSVEELQSLRDISTAHIQSISDLLRQNIPRLAFFDQQQQQQAQMD